MISERLLLWLPAFIALGIGGYFLLPVEPDQWIIAGVAALLVFASLFIRRRADASLILICVLLGFLAGTIRTAIIDTHILPTEFSGGITARVVEAEALGVGYRVVLRDVAFDNEPVPYQIRLVLRDPPFDVRVGDVIQTRGEVKPPSFAVLPEGHDWARAAYFDGLSGYGYATEGVTVLESHAVSNMAEWFQNLRRKIFDRVYGAIGGDTGAIAVALITGERRAIGPQVTEEMRAAGLTHLLAVSGLNIGLAAGIVFFFVRGLLALVPHLTLHWPLKKIASVFSAFAAVFYLFLADWSVPTQRAVLMILVLVLAVLSNRQAMTMRSVALAAGVILLLMPEALLSVSFSLSFAAVIGMVALMDAARDHGIGRRLRHQTLGWLWYYLLGVLFTSAVATLATTPVSLFAFGRLSLFGVLSNMIAVPLTAFWVMPALVFNMALMPLGLDFYWPVAGWGIDIILHVAKFVANLPSATILFPNMTVTGYLILIFGSLWLCLMSGRGRLLSLPVLVLGFALSYTATPPDIFIAPKIVGVRDESDRLWISRPYAEKFVTQQWAQFLGQAQGYYWKHNESPVECKRNLCRAQVKGKTVLFLYNARNGDCGADVIVSLKPAADKACTDHPARITTADIAREKAYAIYLSSNSPARFETVGQRAGRRPWAKDQPAAIQSPPEDAS